MLVVLATRTGAALATVLAWRYVLAAIVLLAMASRARLPAPAGPRGWALVALGALGQGSIAWLGLSALEFIPAATTTFLFYTYPGWITLIAAVRRAEPITRRKLVALALAFTGIAIMVGAPDEVPDPRGVALALSAAVFYAAYVPLLDRLQRGIRPVVVSWIICAGAAGAFVLAAAVRGELTLALAPVAWASVLALAIVSTVIAFRLFLAGLAVIGPVRTGIISTVEPLSTAVLGWALLAQRPGWPTFAGGACILGAVLLLQWRPAGREIEAPA